MRRDRARPPGQAQCRPVQPAHSPRHLFSHPPSCCFWHCLCFAAAAGFVLLPLPLPPLLLLLVAAFMRSPSAFSTAPSARKSSFHSHQVFESCPNPEHPLCPCFFAVSSHPLHLLWLPQPGHVLVFSSFGCSATLYLYSL